ncbi:MAG: hypothetical protein HRU11_01945 [Parvularculaceae bacterium]|nr:hypothetical protein [Parvularculaceae bacterium]
MMMLRVLALGLALAAAGCSERTILTIANDTGCQYKDLTGLKVNPRNGSETIVFRLDQVEPGALRPVLIENVWDGQLKLVSERPPFFAGEMTMAKGSQQMNFSMANDASQACRQGREG